MVVVVFLAAAATALAGGGKGGGRSGSSFDVPRGQWWKRAVMVENLKLSEGQVEKLDDLYVDYRKKDIKLRAEREIVEVDLQKILESKSPDYSAAEKLIDKYEDARSKMSKQRMLMLLGVRKVLTRDQYLKLKSTRSQKGYGGRGKGGKKQGGRGGKGEKSRR